MNVLKQFFIEQKLSQSPVFIHHFIQTGQFTGQVALTLILLSEEVASQIINQL